MFIGFWFLIGFVAAITNLHTEFHAARGGYKFDNREIAVFLMFIVFGVISPILMTFNMLAELYDWKFGARYRKWGKRI